MSDELIELHAFVKGHVQGVFFRAKALEYAVDFGIKGSVSNLSDGRVEIYAQGTQSQLNSFLQKLRDKPGHGRVDSFETTFSKPKKIYTSFKII